MLLVTTEGASQALQAFNELSAVCIENEGLKRELRLLQEVERVAKQAQKRYARSHGPWYDLDLDLALAAVHELRRGMA